MTWFWSRAREPRIRLRDAVPIRRDRRDLRRRFRRAARVAMAERKADTTAVLRRLSGDRVLLSGVMSGPRDAEDIAEFVDGTRLILGVRCGGTGMDRVARGASNLPVWIAQVQPCFGRRLFWLWFVSAGRVAPVEVLTSVTPVPSGGPDTEKW